MIVVLADDLSGAAELAGIAARHGLDTEVQTTFDPTAAADLICLDSDTRLLPAAEAARQVATLGKAISAARPAWVFKKCDSVLRGSVVPEARALAQAAGLPRLRLIPANPSHDRIIRGGEYLIAGLPLDQTPFARDPHHPRRTASVAEMLGEDLAGACIPDIETTDDLRREALALDAATLPVGAADFFRALLAVRVPFRPLPAPQPGRAGPTLIVCGSALAWPRRILEARRHAVSVHPLPHEPEAIARDCARNGRVLIGIGDGPATHGHSARELNRQLAETVVQVGTHRHPERILLEGGDTAATVIRALGWTRLRAVTGANDLTAFEPVGAPTAPRLFIKPGSYDWPDELWPVR